MSCLDKKSFYKGNIIPSFISMGHLYLSQVQDKNSAVIIQASRISELILTYELDIAIQLLKNAKHSTPMQSSSWNIVYNYFNDRNKYNKNFLLILDDINRIYLTYRNTAQHYITPLHPIDNEVETSILNIYKLINLLKPNLCKTLIKELILDNNKFYATYILMYAKIKDIPQITGSFKQNILNIKANELVKKGKKRIKENLSSSILNSFDVLLQHYPTELTKMSYNINTENIPDDHKKYLLLTD